MRNRKKLVQQNRELRDQMQPAPPEIRDLPEGPHGQAMEEIDSAKGMGSHKMKFSLAAFAVAFLTAIQASGFAPQAVALTDTTSKKTRTLFFGLTYGNNSSYLGRYQTEVLPYYSADISYKSKTGFWLSAFAFDIVNSHTFIDEVDVMTGWNVDLSRRVDASVFYSRFFFADSSQLIKASVQNAASASLGLDWSYVYTKVTGHYIFGGGGDLFLVIDNSRYVEFPDVFRKDDYISLEPKITVIAGTQTFVETHYIGRGAPWVTPGNGRPPGRPGSGSTPPSTTESLQETFDILSYEFSLPVSYSTGKFIFELTGRYSIPVNLLEGDTSVPQFFFTGGVVYYINSK